MTKLARQQLILELAHESPLPNQQELVKVLARRGFQVTQATFHGTSMASAGADG